MLLVDEVSKIASKETSETDLILGRSTWSSMPWLYNSVLSRKERLSHKVPEPRGSGFYMSSLGFKVEDLGL